MRYLKLTAIVFAFAMLATATSAIPFIDQDPNSAEPVPPLPQLQKRFFGALVRGALAGTKAVVGLFKGGKAAATAVAGAGAEVAVKKGAEVVAKEAAEKAAKELAEKAAKELAEKAAKEVAEKAAKEAAEKVAKNAAEAAAATAAKQASEAAAGAAAKAAAQGGAEAAAGAAAKAAAQEGAEAAAGAAAKTAAKEGSEAAAGAAASTAVNAGGEAVEQAVKGTFLQRTGLTPKKIAIEVGTTVLATAALNKFLKNSAEKDQQNAFNELQNNVTIALSLASEGSLTEENAAELGLVFKDGKLELPPGVNVDLPSNAQVEDPATLPATDSPKLLKPEALPSVVTPTKSLAEMQRDAETAVALASEGALTEEEATRLGVVFKDGRLELPPGVRVNVPPGAREERPSTQPEAVFGASANSQVFGGRDPVNLVSQQQVPQALSPQQRISEPVIPGQSSALDVFPQNRFQAQGTPFTE